MYFSYNGIIFSIPKDGIFNILIEVNLLSIIPIYTFFENATNLLVYITYLILISIQN